MAKKVDEEHVPQTKRLLILIILHGGQSGITDCLRARRLCLLRKHQYQCSVVILRSSLLAQQSRTRHCHSCSSGYSCGEGSICDLRTQACCGCSQKKKKKAHYFKKKVLGKMLATKASEYTFTLTYTVNHVFRSFKSNDYSSKHISTFFFFFVFCLFRAEPTAYEGSQARSQIGAAATGLHHSHSNTRSEPCLQPTAQLTQHQILNALSKGRNRTQVLMDTSRVR